MANALSDDLFNPLDLDAALDEAYAEGGQEALVELLAAAVDDPRAEGDPELVGYLDELADHYAELGRNRLAIATAQRIIELDPSQRVDELIWIAELQARTGHLEEAREILDRLRAEHEADRETDRDLWQGLSAAVVLADEVGDHVDAADQLAADIRTAIATKADPDLVKALNIHRLRISALAVPPLADQELDEAIVAYTTAAAPTPRPDASRPRPRNQMRIGYFPPAQFAIAQSRKLVEGDHVDHRREVESAMRQSPPGSQRVVEISVDGLLAFADRNGLDPDTPYARLRYAEDLEEPGILWPPDRNDTCWCGSGAKYKKCCRPL